MKLTEAELKVLGAVIHTNGGGLHAGFSESEQITKVIRRLERKGLVQGKLGAARRAVHTKEGLRVWREVQVINESVK
jgi:hypothetical protein